MIKYFKALFSQKKKIEELEMQNAELKDRIKDLDKRISFFEIFSQKQSTILADVAFNQKAVIDFISLSVGETLSAYESMEGVDDSNLIIFPTKDDETYH